MADPAGTSLVLGSASPRRASLLTQLGVPFTVAVIDIDEAGLITAGDAPASVAAIAAAKFAALESTVTAGLLLTADTLVARRTEIMGKPESSDQLRQMLVRMSGEALSIVTAVCLGSPGSVPNPTTVETVVHLRSIAPDEIERYIATGVGMDKAGGLALQSDAGPFIDSVEGCWSNVLGLPLCAVAAALELTPGGSQQQRCSAELCGVHR